MMRIITAILLISLLTLLPACSTIQAGIQATRLLGAAMLDDMEAGVNGIAQADNRRRNAN